MVGTDGRMPSRVEVEAVNGIVRTPSPHPELSAKSVIRLGAETRTEGWWICATSL